MLNHGDPATDDVAIDRLVHHVLKVDFLVRFVGAGNYSTGIRVNAEQATLRRDLGSSELTVHTARPGGITRVLDSIDGLDEVASAGKSKSAGNPYAACSLPFEVDIQGVLTLLE